MSALAEPDTLRKDLMECENTTSHEKHSQSNSDNFIEEKSNLQYKYAAYIQALTGTAEPSSLVWMEHSYARSWRGSAGGPRTLLVRKAPPCPDCHTDAPDSCVLDVLTVDKDPEPPVPTEEVPLLEQALTEDEAYESLNEEIDWEDKLDSLAPSAEHRGLLQAVLETVRRLRTARLAGAPRTAAPYARRLRTVLATAWSPTVVSVSQQQQTAVSWMHAALLAYLPAAFLNCYMDMITILKSKIPHLMDQLIAGHSLGASAPACRPPSPADTAAGTVLLLMPSGRERKDERWARRFRQVLPVQRVQASAAKLLGGITGLVVAGRTRLTALLAERPNTRVVLMGHGVGAAVAIQVALSVAGAVSVVSGGSGSGSDGAGGSSGSGGVAGVVLLAPPLLTAAGPRAMPDDCLLDLPCPALFVVGQNAMQCTIQDVEEVRGRLRVWSRSVLVGAADDQLRLAPSKLRMERVTQEMVECALADEVSSFVRSVLQSKDAPAPAPAPEYPPAHQDSTQASSSESSRRRAAPVHAPHQSKRPRHMLEPVRVVGGRATVRGTGATPMPLPLKVATTTATTLPLQMASSSSSSSNAHNMISPNILDLPIIFADDNKPLEGELLSLPGMAESPPSVAPHASYAPYAPHATYLTTATPPRLNHTISVKRTNLSTPLKYTKVILAKRPSVTGLGDPTSVSSPRVLGRPIIVKGGARAAAVGGLSTFKVFPGVLQPFPASATTPILVRRELTPKGATDHQPEH